MKKNILTKRIVSVCLVVIMAVTLVGCKKTTAHNNDGLTEVTKPDSIKFAINVGLKDGDEVIWKEEYERLTGIKLDFSGPGLGAQYYTDLDLAYATNIEPDVFNVGNGYLPVYVGEGKVADLTELFNNSTLKNKIDPTILEAVTIDGKIYGIPFERGGGTITYVRQDWLDECGLAAPTNYEEFIHMLRVFKENYPDKIPMTAPSLYTNQGQFYLREFYQDATPEFVQVDGVWVDGMSQENMEAALIRLRDAYMEGLLDMEIITNTTTTSRDKWFAGDVGVFTYWAGTWAANLEQRVQSNVATARVLHLPAIEETYYLERVPAVTSIASDAENKEGIFKYFIEYMHDGGEGQLLFESGVEDVHYSIDGNVLTQLEKSSGNGEVYQKAYISPVFRISPYDETEKVIIDFDERVASSIEVFVNNSVQIIETPESKTYTKNSSQIVSLKDRVITSVVTGNMTVEEGLAYYADAIIDLDMDMILAEMNHE